MKREMRASVLPLLAFSVLTACADPPPPAAPKAQGPAAAPAKAENKEDRYGELTADDCRAWADNFGTRLKEANRRRIDECTTKVKAAGGTPSVENNAKDLAGADAETDRFRAMILDQCGQQLGALYVKADAACYMASKKVEEWRDCPFQSMFFSDYKAVARNHQKMFDDRCQSELNKTAGSKPPSAG